MISRISRDTDDDKNPSATGNGRSLFPSPRVSSCFGRVYSGGGGREIGRVSPVKQRKTSSRPRVGQSSSSSSVFRFSSRQNRPIRSDLSSAENASAARPSRGGLAGETASLKPSPNGPLFS